MVLSHILMTVLILAAATGMLLGGSVVALALLLAAVAYWAVAWVACRKAAANVAVDVVAAGACVAGNAPRCAVSASNLGKLPLARVELLGTVRNLLTGEEVPLRAALAVGAGAQSQVNLELRSRWCGAVLVEVVRVRVYDPLGVARRSKSVPVQRTITVFPPLLQAAGVAAHRAESLLECQTYSPYKRGNDATEMFALREYCEGDALRQIHWKLSARTGRLMFKEASLPLMQSVLVFWDHSCTEGEATPERVHALAQALLAVCQGLVDEETRFDLGFDNPEDDTCALMPVSDEGDMQAGISRMMRTPVRPAAETGMQRLARRQGPCTWAQVICVTCKADADLPLWLGEAPALVLECGDADELTVEGAVAIVRFTPQGVASALMMAGVI